MIHGKILRAHDRLTNETEKALTDLKRTLLLLLVCQKPDMPLFSLLKDSFMTQSHGGEHKTVLFFS